MVEKAYAGMEFLELLAGDLNSMTGVVQVTAGTRQQCNWVNTFDGGELG